MKSLTRIVFVVLCLTTLRVQSQDPLVIYTHTEEQPRGTFVGNIRYDMLLRQELSPEENTNLRFRLTNSSGSQAYLFTINETSSTISTTQRIDREAVCPQQRDCLVTLEIAVYKQGAATLDLFKLWKAVVNITDMNDNAPKFPAAQVSLSVSESASPARVLTRGAVDPDTGGNNSVQAYRLTPLSPPTEGLFRLSVVGNLDGSSDLEIVINQEVDRETRDFYQLLITAVDGGYPQKSGSLTVNITVADVNDNKPRFLQQSYNATVEENVGLQTPILQVMAVDDDIGDNARIKYVLSPRATDIVRNSLTIDSQTGVISVLGSIDYEANKQFQFLVEARNEAPSYWSTEAFVVINVLDTNDNAPQISINLSPDGTNLLESEPVGKFVAHVSVSDLDDGDNGRVSCSVDDPSFSLENLWDMYKVILSMPLDYEAAPSHRVTITCRDHGQPALSSSASFTVQVLDVNDLAPIFSKNIYTSSITENSYEVQKLLQVLPITLSFTC